MYSMEKCKVCGISDKVTRKENDAQVVGWPDSTFDGVNNKHTGGKPRGTVPHSPAMQSNIKEETLSIRRDWRNNGNEIGVRNRRGQVPEIFHKESLKVL